MPRETRAWEEQDVYLFLGIFVEVWPASPPECSLSRHSTTDQTLARAIATQATALHPPLHLIGRPPRPVLS